MRDRLKAALARALPLPVAGDRGFKDEGPAERRPAAVLIGIVAREDGPTVLFTRRTAHLTAHAGQISFPGGRIEPDDRDAVHAALREAEEEIGLDPEKVDVIGRLQPYDTGTGFRVWPVVGWIEPPVAFRLDPFEVDELFEVPLAHVLDAANHRRGSFEREGRRREFYVVPFEHYEIWGATAGMIVNFAAALRDIDEGLPS